MFTKFEQNRLMYHRLMASERGDVFFSHPVLQILYDLQRNINFLIVLLQILPFRMGSP